MSNTLTARVVNRVETDGSVIADVVVCEANGDEYTVHCICRPDGTEVGGSGDDLKYLNERYGDVYFCTTIREAALRA
jgi:hypothetical protein